MRIIVSSIPENGLEQQLSVPVNINNDSSAAIASVSLRIDRIEEKVLIKGSIHVSVHLTCSRCVTEYSEPLSIEFTDEYNPISEILEESEREIMSSELNLSYYEGDEIEISHLIREQVLLAVPMKPLCSAECKGMCAHCGINLNQRSCSCSVVKEDPRLAPLRKFKELMKERKG